MLPLQKSLVYKLLDMSVAMSHRESMPFQTTATSCIYNNVSRLRPNIDLSVVSNYPKASTVTSGAAINANFVARKFFEFDH